ncbi:MAG: SDR family NAD(P)-dependent oxidoreductase, partial [Nostoc sp.]
MTQKTWFITGASRGIGAEIAKAVLTAGNQLIATARNKTDLDQFESNPNVLTLNLDVTDEAQVQAAVAAALERFGQIDVLVNNAG